MRTRTAPPALLSPATTRGRLLGTGLPLVLSSSTLVVIPVIARHVLGDVDYAAWALLTTVVVGAGLLDLGGSAYLQSLGFGRRPTRRAYASALALAGGGAVLVSLLALAGGVVVTARSSASGPLADHLVGLVALTGCASVARGAVLVLMARLQVSLRFRLRGAVAVLHTVLQVGLCWAGLAVGWGVWSLGVGVLGGSLVTFAVTHAVLAARPDRVAPVGSGVALPRFAGFRTSATVLALLSSQADRWVLALVATPGFLADYDLALRLAQLPVGLVGALLVGLVSETSAVDGHAARQALVRRATRTTAALVLSLTVACGAGVLLLGVLGLLPTDARFLALFALASLWLGVNAVSAPTGFASIGIGRPDRELFYSAPMVATMAVGWMAALVTHDARLVVAGALVAVTGWSIWFVHYGVHRARY